MSHSLSRRALIAAAALSFAAGCSANGTNPSQSSLTPSAYQGLGGVRILPGPVVSGPIVVPLTRQRLNAPMGWPKKKKAKQILFVSDGSSGVEMYDPKVANGSPEGSITTGTDGPFGLAVDKKGTLYVVNIDNSTVTVYPPGATEPSLTISSGLSTPYGIAVDSKGNVFVSNLGTNDIEAYKSGTTSPYESINFNSYGQAVGVGVDGKDNIWVACDSTNAVYEIPAGSSGVSNSGLTELFGPIDVAFGQNDEIFVSNFSTSDVVVYKYGSTTPFETITSGIESSGPTFNDVTHSGLFFQANQDDNVVGYKKGQTTPFSTLDDTTPAGIASSPLVKK